MMDMPFSHVYPSSRYFLSKNETYSEQFFSLRLMKKVAVRIWFTSLRKDSIKLEVLIWYSVWIRIVVTLSPLP